VDTTVFFAVLAAAALHASWNAVVRVNRDRFLAVALISLGSGFAGLVLLPFVPVPAPAAWPWLIASVLVHTAYKLSLAEAYRTGDLGQIYPLARGTAPLLVACFGFVALNEALAPTAVAGLVVLVLGIWLMALRGGRAVAAPDVRSVAYALVTATLIALYTVLDGLGARSAGTASSYAIWLFAFDGVLMLPILLRRRGMGWLTAAAPVWKSAALGGVMSLAAYWIAIWAMTVAHLATVAALRETSVLFALAISVVFLREPLSGFRLAAAALMLCGVVVMRLA